MPRLTLGLGDLAASGHQGDQLVTLGLGSCVAIILRDRATRSAALAHVVVPGAPPPTDPTPRPAWYALAAVKNIFQAFRDIGGGRPEVVLVGGATAVGGLNGFDVGRRNVLAIRRALWGLGLVPLIEDVEGTMSRSVTVDVGQGLVSVRSPETGTRILGNPE
ncbi:MAG: chemotaxis protein CheD [Myxococcales bacterium]|nr:chemotaxis protein CheD [Myxococcales bacterium]